MRVLLFHIRGTRETLRPSVSVPSQLVVGVLQLLQTICARGQLLVQILYRRVHRKVRLKKQINDVRILVMVILPYFLLLSADFGLSDLEKRHALPKD